MIATVLRTNTTHRGCRLELSAGKVTNGCLHFSGRHSPIARRKERQMPHPCSSFRSVLSLTLGAVVLAAISAAGQTQKPFANASRSATAPPGASAAPRTADGRADLQGTWDFAQL